MSGARSVVARLLHWLAATAVLVAVAWTASGGLQDPIERLYVAAFSAAILFGSLAVDPELARERLRPGPGGVDRRMPALARAAVLAGLLVGFLDGGRFPWSPPLATPLRIVAVAAFALALVWAMWAVTSNRFFSPVVRIQSERGHYVVTGGPYRWVRHPGYGGMLVAIPASALALGSWWGLVPGVAFAAVVIRRILLEDRYLREHLEGYRAYADVVRYRLVPGLW